VAEKKTEAAVAPTLVRWSSSFSTIVDGPPLTEEQSPPAAAEGQPLPAVRKLGGLSEPDERVFSTWGRLSD
jgi:hypothetical protein